MSASQRFLLAVSRAVRPGRPGHSGFLGRSAPTNGDGIQASSRGSRRNGPRCKERSTASARADLIPQPGTLYGRAGLRPRSRNRRCPRSPSQTVPRSARDRTSGRRRRPTNPNQLAAFDQAQGQLGAALSRLLVVSERYPELRATANFGDLQAQLEGTENRIAVERGRFNDAVQAYDTAIRRFPAALIAGMFGFTARPYLRRRAGRRNAPKGGL